MDQNKIGEFIAQCRKEHNMTQMQFAEKLGVTNKAVSKWETGKCLPDAAWIGFPCEILFYGFKLFWDWICIYFVVTVLAIVGIEYSKRNLSEQSTK